MQEPIINYESRNLSPALSRLAVVSFVIPFLVFFSGAWVINFIEHTRDAMGLQLTTVQNLEFGFGVLPEAAAFVLALVAIARIEKRKPKLRGLPWAIAGLVLSVAMGGALFFWFVMQHSWMD